MTPPLPSELVGLVFSHLSNDYDTLKQCSLVCKDWVPHTRERLFQSWRLRPIIPSSPAKLDFLESAYTAHVRYLVVPPLALLGRKLDYLARFTNVVHLQFNIRWAQISSRYGRLLHLFSLLPLQSIIKLTLNEIEINEISELTDIPSALPALESLNLASIFVPNPISAPHQSSGMSRGAGVFPKLKRLKCQNGPDPISRVAFLNWLASDNGRESFPSLKDISIRDIEQHELPAIRNLFRVLGPALSKLSVTWNDAISPALIKTHLDLGRSSMLQSIKVRFRFYYSSVSVLEPPSVPPQSASVSLEEITIIFDGSMNIEMVSKVDWSLMDNTLSDPSFTKLRRITFLLSVPENPVNQSAVTELRGRLPKITSMGIVQWGRLLVTKKPRRL